MPDPIDMTAAALREAITSTIVPLQTTRVLEPEPLEEIVKQAQELTRLLKGHEQVSKALLNELFVVVNVLRNEAPSFPAERARLEDAANRIEYCLSLILLDEIWEEGGPRVI